MAKIKVAHIITKLELGGAQANTLYTVSHLPPDQFEALLIAGPGGALDNEARLLPKTIFCQWLIRDINPLYDFLALLALRRLLRKEKPDIVHTHSSKAGILGRWAAWWAGVPVIVHTFHGFGFHGFQNPVIRWFYITLERLTAKKTDRLIAVSHELIKKARELRIGRPDQYLMIHSGIKRSEYLNCRVDRIAKRKSLELDQALPVIMMAAPFKPQKNILGFLQLAAKIVLKLQASFVLVGDGEERSAVEQERDKLDLQNHVSLIGWRRDMPEIYAMADIFVLTSLWEGLPRSIVEAMASGLAVVAHAVDGVKEIVREGENGFLVEPFDVDTMTERVLQLLDFSDLRKRIGQAGRITVDVSYDIDEMVRNQEKLYTSLMKQLYV